MKTRLNLFKKTVLFLFTVLCFTAVQAQEDAASLKSAIEAKQFVFNAQTVLPPSGSTRQVAGDRYTVRVAGDSLRSDLPYFGRAYSASYGATDGGIKFISTTFEYSVKNRRKGGWEIVMRPKDVTDFRQFLLTVSENGFATLRALSNNRQPISFTGNVAVVR